MPPRSSLWLCVIVCTLVRSAAGQAIEAAEPLSANTTLSAATADSSTTKADKTDSKQPTLDQLKAAGALRSQYLGQQPPSVDQIVPEANLAVFEQVIQPILQEACVQCHGSETVEGNIRIDTLDPNLLQGQDVEWWVEVLAVVGKGEMPPPDDVELTDENRGQIIDWLSSEVLLASRVRRASGQHPSFRRMTRYEYNYALQDILGLPWDFAKDLPPEAHSEDGFQNSSEMLHMSVTQFETYRVLARKALQRATMPAFARGESGERPSVIQWGITMQAAADREWPAQNAQLEEIREKFKDDPIKQTQELEQLTASFTKPHGRTYYRNLSTGRTAIANWNYGGAKYAFAPLDAAPEMPSAFDHVAVIPAGRNQHLTVELGDQIPDEGIMRVRVRASRASNEPTRSPSLSLEFGWQASNEGRAEIRVSKVDLPIDASPDSPAIYQWEFPLGEIYPRNSVRHISKMGDLPSPSEYIRFINSSVPQGGPSEILIDYVEVAAPVYDQWPPQPYQRVFFDSENRENETAYAREVLSAFMSRAWRREVSHAEVQQKVELFHAMRDACDGFEEAMLEVLATVLSSPHFIYVNSERDVAEQGSANASISEDAAHSQRLSADALATRLSLFLWCSIPDAELLQLAASGRLLESTVLRGQVDRMLADPRSRRFSEHFVRQWLNMQLLDFLDVKQKSETFDPLLKEAMQREPIELFHEMLGENESVLNFIHADYTMANERLALHYALPDVAGNEFRRVKLGSSARRGGLLTQAGLLAMNSDGVDSHPLKRGVWLLERILNDPPPPPPPAVPEIDLADPEIAKLTLKQRIEDHRNHAACMSCHAKIDPWGIAFENYDATGLWRDKINGQPVDATSLLFNKQELDGIDGLKRYLLNYRQDQFVRALVHKLTTYAIGRPVTFGDHASIDKLTADVRQNEDGLATIVRSIVSSELFQSK
jgi:mono/diheme cytochrome c family protein